MKVGIMTMQRICNYGSFLQAYCLKKTIESLNHEVVFVDFKRGKPITYAENKAAYYKNRVREIIMSVAARNIDFLFFANEEQKYSLQFKKKYNNSFLPLIGVGRNKKYNTEVDILVIGSDEVFNCLQSNPEVGFSEELFGFNNKAKKVLSYAASFGNTTMDGLVEYGKAERIKELLSEFSMISVRDDNSYQIIESLLGKSAEINLDPVLIYDLSSDIIEPVVDDDYIVVYAYRNRIRDEEKEQILAYAKSVGKKIYAIGGYQDFCDKNIQGTPFEILGYIKNASCVVTDTFHGSIFSIINEKPFVTFIRTGHKSSYGNYEKLMDLLERLRLKDRAITGQESLYETMMKPIDYGAVREIILDEKRHTIDYLKRNLSDDECV